LIIDLGTSGTKVTVLDEGLHEVRETRFATPFRRHAGIPSLDPEAILDAVFSGIRSFSLDELPAETLSISVTGMGSTIMAASPDGGVIVPAVSWEYCGETAAAAAVDLGGTGKVILPTYPFFKIPWLREQVGDMKAVYLSLPDYVLAAFDDFRRFATDYSFASRSLLFSDLAYTWDAGILEHLHISTRELPDLCAAGEAGTPVAAAKIRDLRLPAASSVYPGMHDHLATAYLGVRLIESGRGGWVNAAGTTESLICTANRAPELVRSAPASLLNTEATWDEHTLALVGYTCPSGKIMNAADQFDIDWRNLEKGWTDSLLPVPPRKRNLPNDGGRLRAAGETVVSWNSVWKQLVLSTQF
jgi:sugar (pentulose or hexulose) kinase